MRYFWVIIYIVLRIWFILLRYSFYSDEYIFIPLFGVISSATGISISGFGYISFLVFKLFICFQVSFLFSKDGSDSILDCDFLFGEVFLFLTSSKIVN